MARKKQEYVVLTVDARTGNGGEACRVGSQDVALAIARRLRYQQMRTLDERNRTKLVPKYEQVRTMKVVGDKWTPVVVR